MSLAARLRFWLRALLTLALLLASSRAFARAGASSRANANGLALSSQPSGPPRPGEARRKAGPGRAQLASTPGRIAPSRGGAALHPLWLVEGIRIIYPELDAIGNIRHVHAGVDPAIPTFTGDLGGFSYSAFGKSLALSDPGGIAPPMDIAVPFQWQGKRIIGSNLYDSRARVWSADLGAFLQPDEYGFLTRGGALWSWPGQNPVRWRDPSGRDVSDWILHQSWIDDLAPALAAAGAESGVPGVSQAGEAALLAIEGINAMASLEAHRQSAAAIAKATSNDDECEDERPARADHREKTRGANKNDRKQIDAAARQAGVDRRGFGKFIEAEKHATGQDPSDNFTYEELLDLAEQYKNSGGG